MGQNEMPCVRLLQGGVGVSKLREMRVHRLRYEVVWLKSGLNLFLAGGCLTAHRLV